MWNFESWITTIDPIRFVILIIVTACLILFLRKKLVRFHQAHQDQLAQIKAQLDTLISAGPGENVAFDQGPSSETKIYVGNVDYSTSETELETHFNRFGEIEFVNIPLNRYNGKARGFGFVAFKSGVAAEGALALDGSEFRGRQIQVNFAKERERTEA